MCPIEDIMDFSEAYIVNTVGSSYAICPLSKNIYMLSVHCPIAELKSVIHELMDGQTNANKA